MSKFVVSVFDDEKAAYEGSKAMLSLDAVITKDSNGVVQIEDAVDEGPMGMATGMMIGTLIGGLGGAAGMAAGASAGAAGAALAAGAAGGTMGGWFADLYNVGVDAEFLNDVGTLMTPGKSAVVAEIAEGWTIPLGGTVFRRYRIDVEDEQIERDIDATNRELDELEEEWDQAVGEAKEKLKVKVDAAREKLSALNDKANAKLESLKKEAHAKIEKMNQQITNAP